MFWLLTQMWILVLSAFAIGLGVGWWIWAVNTKKTEQKSPMEMGTLDSDLP